MIDLISLLISGQQNDVRPKTSMLIVWGTYEYAVTWQRGIKVANGIMLLISWLKNREIILDCPKVITSVLKGGRKKKKKGQS